MSSMTGEVVAQAGDAFDVKWDDGRVLTGYNSKDFVEEGGNITAYTVQVPDDVKFGKPGHLINGAPLICEDLTLEGVLGTVFKEDGTVLRRFVIKRVDDVDTQIEVSEDEWQRMKMNVGTDGRVPNVLLQEV